MADTHARYDRYDPGAFPTCDVFLFAGDVAVETEAQLRAFDRWLGRLPVERAYLTPGNHDFVFETKPDAALENGRCLLHESTTLQGVSFFGSPFQPAFFDLAFNRPRGEALRSLWADIPETTDVLLTHTPPAGVLDVPARCGDEGVGCGALRRRLEELSVDLHVFGHVHEDYGVERRQGTTFVNAACYSRHEPRMRTPWRLEYDPDRGLRTARSLPGPGPIA